MGGAAQAATVAQIPMISPTSTSPALSEGLAYPYFLRTPASDSFKTTMVTASCTFSSTTSPSPCYTAWLASASTARGTDCRCDAQLLEFHICRFGACDGWM